MSTSLLKMYGIIGVSKSDELLSTAGREPFMIKTYPCCKLRFVLQTPWNVLMARRHAVGGVLSSRNLIILLASASSRVHQLPLKIQKFSLLAVGRQPQVSKIFYCSLFHRPFEAPCRLTHHSIV